jgi:ubiquinone/menaquinone biosynthesis C-methylase UbiE
MNFTLPKALSILKLFSAMSSKPSPKISNYERMSGNCTRILASQLISGTPVELTNSSYILDNACGPGMVSEQIKLKYPDAEIMATDLSPAMIEALQEKIKVYEWSNMKTDVLDIRNLSTLKDETFSHAFLNLGLPVIGDAEAGVKVSKELFRVLKVGGVAMVTTWAGK